MANPVHHLQQTSFARPAAILLATLVLCCGGCQSLNVKSPFPWERDAAKKSPDKIMAVWTDAVKTEPGKPSERGFGGRVFFYDNQGKTMKVDGEVSIYLFDDDSRLEDAQTPEKKFVFPAETLALRYSKCSLGDSYNFWVPVGPVIGPNRKLSLVTKIELDQGGSVVSGVTRKILPGSGYPATAATTPRTATAPSTPNDSATLAPPEPAEPNPIAQAGYIEPVDSATPASSSTVRSIAAETIQLTPSFTERLRRAADENKEPQGKRQDSPGSDSAPQSAPATTPSSSSTGSTSRQPVPDSLAAHSEPTTPPAQNQPSIPPTATHPRYQPHRAGWLSSLPPTPRSGFQNARPKLERSALQQSRRAAVTFPDQVQSQVPAVDHVTYSVGAGEQDD